MKKLIFLTIVSIILAGCSIGGTGEQQSNTQDTSDQESEEQLTKELDNIKIASDLGKLAE